MKRNKGLSVRQVEVDHLKTSIIALHEEFKVVEDEKRDVVSKREKEAHHGSSGSAVGDFLEATLQREAQEEEDKNRKFEDMLAKESADLQDDVQTLIREMDRVNKERDDQRRRYDAQIKAKDDIIVQFANSNELIKQEIREMRSCVRLEELEKELNSLKNGNFRQQEQKGISQEELREANKYIGQLDDKIYKANNTSLELLRQLKDAETEIETLKHYIIELKQRIAVYIPVKDDAIDRKLAEYINNYPERAKLKIMFMRETEGIY